MSKIAIRLPWPPTINHYWISRAYGGKVMVVLGAKGQRFREDVAAEVWRRFGSIKPSRSRMRVNIVAVLPNRLRRDIDNLLKATLDALSHAQIWQDDSQVDELSIKRGRVEAPGWLEVEIEQLPGVTQGEMFV